MNPIQKALAQADRIQQQDRELDATLAGATHIYHGDENDYYVALPQALSEATTRVKIIGPVGRESTIPAGAYVVIPTRKLEKIG